MTLNPLSTNDQCVLPEGCPVGRFCHKKDDLTCTVQAALESQPLETLFELANTHLNKGEYLQAWPYIATLLKILARSTKEDQEK